MWSKYLFLSLLFFLLIGCATEEKNNNKISLEDINSVELKVVFEFELSGLDSNGNEINSSISLVNEANLLGTEYPDIVRILSINGLIITRSDITFDMDYKKYDHISPEGKLRGLLTNTGLICQNPMPDKLPDLVNIDDTGVLESLDCLGLLTRYRTWNVEDNEQGDIKVTIETEEIPRRSEILITAFSYILDSEGKIIGIEVEISEADFGLDQNSNPIMINEVFHHLKTK